MSWAQCGMVFLGCLALIAAGLYADERRNRRRDIPFSRINDCKPGAFQTSSLTRDWK